ncbi:hypothetical protein HYX12_04665 [Candidatus Woesearchaeota archaeon]|nr:hypothetical protein [Candidatus Woesearchaeota archaeon]
MNKNIFLIGLLVGIIFVSGCIQQENSTFKSDVQQETSTKNEIQFIDVNEKLTCVDPFDLRDKEFIINSNEDYQKLSDYKSSSPKCEDFELSSIDFSQYTLLGKYAQGGGCSIDFLKKVYKDDLNKKITYSIKIVEEGSCEKMGANMNWILIPKVPSDYTFEFNVK